MKLLRNPYVRGEVLADLALTTILLLLGLLFPAAAPWLIAACGAALLVLHVIFVRRRYRYLEELSQSLDRILHGQQSLLADDGEGELAILTSEIQKLLVRLNEQADRLKGEKVYLTEAIEDIFHQLRTPLTGMNLTVQLLEREDLDYAGRIRLLRDLKRQLARIQWQVEALLKLSKIDAGTAVFMPEELAAAELLRRASESLLIPMELRGQTLKLNCAGERLTADPGWTAEAIENLLKNCMEHTPEGGTVTVTAEETALYTGLVIQDTGEGFDTEDIPNLFTRFYRGKNAAGGSIGIGLALSRMILAAQNATIKADNAPEGGARFTIRFYKSIV